MISCEDLSLAIFILLVLGRAEALAFFMIYFLVISLLWERLDVGHFDILFRVVLHPKHRQSAAPSSLRVTLMNGKAVPTRVGLSVCMPKHRLSGYTSDLDGVERNRSFIVLINVIYV